MQPMSFSPGPAGTDPDCHCESRGAGAGCARCSCWGRLHTKQSQEFQEFLDKHVHTAVPQHAMESPPSEPVSARLCSGPRLSDSRALSKGLASLGSGKVSDSGSETGAANRAHEWPDAVSLTAHKYFDQRV